MNEAQTFGLVMACILFGGLCGFLTGTEMTEECWKDECVERGVAEYDSQTGQWHWKDGAE